MTRLHVIGNPTRDSSYRKHVQGLRRRGHDVVDLTGQSAPATDDALAAAVLDGKIERLIVIGGDGLAHLAVQRVAGTDITLGLVPSGTGNDFAAALGLGDSGLDTALHDSTPVDLIEVIGPDGTTAGFVASIAIAGFPAAINARANEMNARLGPAIYTVAAALELPRFSRLAITLNVDGEPIETDTAMLAIGNTRFFGGGMLACPDAVHDDGLLHLTSIEGVGRLGILRHLVGNRGGTADRPEVLRRTATEIELSTPGIDVWGDGEPVGATPLTMRIRPGALLVAGVVTTAINRPN